MEIADDLAQDALLKAYMSYTRFEGRSKFSTWLFRIAYNCFYDWKKGAGKLQTAGSTIRNSILPSTPCPKTRRLQCFCFTWKENR